MKTTLQVVVDHSPVGDKPLEESAEIMKGMVRRAIEAKAPCWKENVSIESVTVKQAVEEA